MKDVQLNLEQISSIIEGLEISINLYEMKQQKFRSKYDKQWAGRMVEKYTDVKNTMLLLKQEFEEKVIRDHQKYNYSIRAFFGDN